MLKKTLVPLVLLALTGCVSAKITSTKDTAHTTKIDNVVVVMRGVDKADKFFVELIKLMDLSLKERQITAHFHILPSNSDKQTKLTLDPENDITTQINKEIEGMIKKYQPNYVMIINQTKMEVVYGNVNPQEGGTFDIRLLKPGQDKLIWRANLEMFSNAGFKNGAKKSNNRLIEKLSADGLI